MNEQEQRWIQAARGGDEAAFGELVRLYQKRVYALAVRLCPTPERFLRRGRAFRFSGETPRFRRGCTG